MSTHEERIQRLEKRVSTLEHQLEDLRNDVGNPGTEISHEERLEALEDHARRSC